LENGETRTVLNLPPALAPIKVAVLPLVKKDGLPEKAREIIDVFKICRTELFTKKKIPSENDTDEWMLLERLIVLRWIIKL
jgi:hypothetical protein